MPYPTDLVGKFLKYRIDPGATSVPPGVALVDGLLPGQTVPENLAVFSDGAAPMMGVHRAPAAPVMGGHRAPEAAYTDTRRNWSFRFLKYVAGAVTSTSIGTGVLTGPMTGCFLCRYTRGGQSHMAHIGTYLKPDSDESLAAKQAWAAFATRADVTDIEGNSPADFFTFGELAAVATPGALPQVCGYFEANRAYAIAVVPVPAGGGRQPMLRVAAVKDMPLMQWSAIAGLRTFRM